jgi:hypothetical protein
MNFSLWETLDEIWARHFQDVDVRPDGFFVERGPLACVQLNLPKSTIYVHSILNHPSTPKIVIDLICKHELLHLRIPPRLVKGRLKQHPPEFSEAEASLTPERAEAWSWLSRARGSWLRPRPRLERIDVVRGWTKVWDTSEFPQEEADRYFTRLRLELGTGRLYL